MSEYLAIDFDRHRLAGVRARINNQRLRVEESFELHWPAEIDHWDDPAAAGEWLKNELARLSVSGDDLLVSLPRDEVVVRQLDVPDVPDEDLPSLVRLQAETKSAAALSQHVLDFLPLPRSQPSTARQVLMITIAQERLDRLTEMTTAAGLELASVGISAVATGEVVARAEARMGAERDEAALVVTQTQHRVEIALVRNDHLLFTHSAQLGGGDSAADRAATLAEVRRSLGALARLDAELHASRAWVVGAATETTALRSLLEEHLDCKVSVLEPMADPAVDLRENRRPRHQAQLAGPIGMLLATVKPSVATVDLLRPRKPLVRPDRRRLKLGLAIGGVAVLVALAFGNTIWRTRTIDRQIQSVQDQIARADQVVERAGPTLTTARLIDEWDQRDVDFLFQLTELNRILPGTDRVYLQDLRFSPLAGEAIARIQANGRARSRDDVQQLYQRLVDHKYRVKPHEILTHKDDKEYPIEFELDVTVTAATNSRFETTSPRVTPNTGDDTTERTAAENGIAAAAKASGKLKGTGRVRLLPNRFNGSFAPPNTSGGYVLICRTPNDAVAKVGER